MFCCNVKYFLLVGPAAKYFCDNSLITRSGSEIT